MIGIGIEIRGSDAIAAKLDALIRIADENLEEIAVVGALPIATGAKQRAVVKTGNMKRSIHIGGHVGKTPDTRLHGDVTNYGEVAGPQRGTGRVTLSIGTRVSYARQIEYGGGGRISASARSALAKYGGGASGGNYRAARPFLRPAFDDAGIRAKSRRQSETAFKLLAKRAWRS